VCEALKRSIGTLPVQLRRSLTWDQGKEISEHRRFSVESGVEVYFCDPQSPWQRGSNENTNGLLRQYLPRGQSLAGISQERLNEIANKLNRRPRKTLGFQTPGQKLAELIDGLAQRSALRLTTLDARQWRTDQTIRKQTGWRGHRLNSRIHAALWSDGSGSRVTAGAEGA
jgi:hypothetical protein